MPTRILKENLESSASKSNTTRHCEESKAQASGLYSSDTLFDNRDGFNAEISCAVKCRTHKDKATHSIDSVFHPKEQGMQKGDGGLWASLTTTLKYWSEESCFDFAAHHCEGLNQVEEVSRKSVRSGDWELKDHLLCGKKQPIVLSPYQKKVDQLNEAFRPRQRKLVSPELKSFAVDWRTSFRIGGGREKVLSKDIEHCSQVVTANFCYGDCVALEGEFEEQYLATPAPLGEDQYKICMDPLVKKLEGRTFPKSLVAHLCETRILKALKDRNATGLTCASSRLETDCSALNID